MHGFIALVILLFIFDFGLAHSSRSNAGHDRLVSRADRNKLVDVLDMATSTCKSACKPVTDDEKICKSYASSKRDDCWCSVQTLADFRACAACNARDSLLEAANRKNSVTLYNEFLQSCVTDGFVIVAGTVGYNQSTSSVERSLTAQSTATVKTITTTTRSNSTVATRTRSNSTVTTPTTTRRAKSTTETEENTVSWGVPIRVGTIPPDEESNSVPTIPNPGGSFPTTTREALDLGGAPTLPFPVATLLFGTFGMLFL